MILICILFGLIITLDVIVYGLYRMIKKEIERLNREIERASRTAGAAFFNARELQKVIKKESEKNKTKKKGMKVGRPRKQDTTG